MTPATPNQSSGPPSGITSLRAATPATPTDARKKAHLRLADRIDLVRNRHKPLSILRAEARRLLEQFYDQEGTALTRSDRDRLIEDILAESNGFGPLEEIFRDDAVKEVLVLGPGSVIGRKGEGWLPLSGRYRDAEQFRAALARWQEVGEPYVGGPANSGGFDVRLPNGFRAVVTLPPEVMEAPPQALLVRGAPIPSVPGAVPGGAGISSPSGVGSMSGIYRSVITTPAPRGSQSMSVPPYGAPHSTPHITPHTSSGPIPSSAPRSVPGAIPGATSAAGHGADKPDSGVISLGATMAPTYAGRSAGGSLSSANVVTDPMARLRQRVTEKIIGKFAAAGVYDLNSIPLPELRRIILAQVGETLAQEKLGGDESLYDRLTIEILAAMSR